PQQRAVVAIEDREAAAERRVEREILRPVPAERELVVAAAGGEEPAGARGASGVPAMPGIGMPAPAPRIVLACHEQRECRDVTTGGARVDLVGGSGGGGPRPPQAAARLEVVLVGG